MKLFSVSEEDLQLLNAIKPFMSNKSQDLIDLSIAVLNVFRPTEPNKRINIDALSELLTMLQESSDVKKTDPIKEQEDDDFSLDLLEDNETSSESQTKDVENLLHLLANNKKDLPED